jgi:hypothetical protein
METKDFIQSAKETGEPGAKWMSEAENFARQWKQLDGMFGAISGIFNKDDFTEDECLWVFDKNTGAGIPDGIWFSIWEELGMTGAFNVIIDGTIVDIGVDMYIAYRNGAFGVPGQDLTRSVAMFLASMENEALKHSTDPFTYMDIVRQQTGMHDMFCMNGTKPSYC